MITAEQVVVARKLLGWPRSKLAKKARIGTRTIGRVETAEGELPATIATLNQIQAALEAAGIDFTGEQPTIAFRSGEHA